MITQFIEIDIADTSNKVLEEWIATKPVFIQIKPGQLMRVIGNNNNDGNYLISQITKDKKKSSFFKRLFSKN